MKKERTFYKRSFKLMILKGITMIQSELFPNHSFQEKSANFSEIYVAYGSEINYLDANIRGIKFSLLCKHPNLPIRLRRRTLLWRVGMPTHQRRVKPRDLVRRSERKGGLNDVLFESMHPLDLRFDIIDL